MDTLGPNIGRRHRVDITDLQSKPTDNPIGQTTTKGPGVDPGDTPLRYVPGGD